jgi:Protein of unknown function (DUF3455)
MTKHTASITLAISAVSLLTACASTPQQPAFSQSTLPDAVKVPAGHRVTLETVGRGTIDYECRVKAGMAGAFEWVFVGPDAKLFDRKGNSVGRYFGPPATWESADGSKITGAQVAVAPAQAGSIPLQLVKANPASGPGAMKGVSYIQRVATNGGVAPSDSCASSNTGARKTVNYQADYIFWSPN